MAKLKEVVQVYIVRALASFESPSKVAEMVKEEFGLVVTRQQVAAYDATKTTGRTMAKRWRELHAVEREKFQKEVMDIPIANQAYRLKQLQDMYSLAIKRKNIVLASQLMEQAAKELGGMFTAKRLLEHTGKDGKPIETVSKVQRLNFLPVGSKTK